MADVKISQLPVATTPLDGTEVLPIVQSATTKQVSIANVTAGRAMSASSLTLTTPLAVTSGGTGLATVAQGALLSATGADTLSATRTPTLGLAGTAAGTLGLSGATSGVVTLATAAAAGTWTFTLPTSGGTNGYILTTNGAGVSSWTDPTALGIDLDIGTTAITGGTTTRVLFNNGNFLGEASSLTISATTNKVNVVSAPFGLSGNISSAAWTTSGIRYQNTAATITDTSSSGTVATAYTDLFGGNTIAASNSTTFTNYYTMFIQQPTAGSNVTFTNRWAIGTNGNVNIGGSLTLGTALSVANGGTGLTSLTAGYVPFGAGTSAFGNSANLFWDNTNARLGIGTSSPTVAFNLYQTINANAVTTAALFQDAGSSGGTSYQYRITVSGRSGAGSLDIGTTDSSTSHYNGQACVFVAGNTLPFYLVNLSNQPLLFGTNNAERMRIDASGNVLVGTTTASAKTTVESTSNVQPALFLNNSASSGTANPVISIRKFDNNTTTSNVFVQFTVNNGNTGSGQINANGASQAAFGSFSDARLKTNIVDLGPQLANVLALRPREFDYLSGGHQTGFIAQEMEKVYPDAVSESADGMLMITGWSKTEARLVAAIQELAAKVSTLEDQLNA